MTTPARLLRRQRDLLEEAGLAGSFLVRDLDSGEEIGIDPDDEYVAGSLVKVPLASTVLAAIHSGELDGAAQVRIAPGGVTTEGPTGLTRFRHPATIALEDLLYLATSISDGTAADALSDFMPPERASEFVRGLGIDGLMIRHRFEELVHTPTEALGREQNGRSHGRAHPRVARRQPASATDGPRLRLRLHPLTVQPHTDALMAQVARALRDHLRAG